MGWFVKHLGHSLNVHNEYYRNMSSVIEKAKIGRLLLMADEGKLGNFQGKKLADLQIDDIPVTLETEQEKAYTAAGNSLFSRPIIIHENSFCC